MEIVVLFYIIGISVWVIFVLLVIFMDRHTLTFSDIFHRIFSKDDHSSDKSCS